jgi:hypothetical protein
MKYVLLLRFPPGSGPQEGAPEFDAEMGAWGAVNDELNAAGAWIAAAGLELDDATTTLRATQGERVLTDGPFAETKELLFSYYVIDVADLDAAATSSTTRATPPPPATTWCATSSATMRCAWPGCWPS